MTASVLAQVASAGSSRLLADVNALGAWDSDDRTPALLRLEAVLGRDFADRLVTALSDSASRTAVIPSAGF